MARMAQLIYVSQLTDIAIIFIAFDWIHEINETEFYWYFDEKNLGKSMVDWCGKHGPFSCANALCSLLKIVCSI